MAVASTHTVQPHVLDGTLVRIEADLARGLHSFSVVGLAGKAVDEAKDRVSAAIAHSGFTSPRSTSKRITVSLSPADIKKEGPLFDLPIAVAYLAAAEEIRVDDVSRVYIGELALDGSLRPVHGVLAVVLTAKRAGYTEVIVPTKNADEAALVSGITIYPADCLADVLAHIDHDHPHPRSLPVQPETTIPTGWENSLVQLEDIKGHSHAKRALAIAAAGRHNIMLVGPPGTGKTMLARALQSILPPLSREEALAVTSIHSVAGTLEQVVCATPPFRAPHHTASHTALVGGGSNPRPGEVTLAHHGVLFMDEFPEFERRSLDALRQPLEDRVVSISRVQHSALFPADFVLVAALNPYRGSEDGTTDYIQAIRDSYGSKISGPILDRIDLWVEVPHIDYDTLATLPSTEGETDTVRRSIQTARERMHVRSGSTGRKTNAQLSSRELDHQIPIPDDVAELLRTSAQKLNLSPRSYHRLIKVARTIADLDDAEHLTTNHVLEALQYRVKV